MFRIQSYRRVAGGACALISLLLAAAGAQALTVVPRAFPELVQQAELIVVGTVDGARSAWSADGRTISTTVNLVDLELIKGEVPSVPYELILPGGIVGDTAQTYPGMPQLVAGGRYVLFVRGNRSELIPLVGAYQGLYRVLADPDGQQRVLRADRRDSLVVRALVLPSQPTLEEFTARIREQMLATEPSPAP
ncbi:MAG: hypothetical protein AB7Q01_05085 [Gammaproteobacteria bacterium]